MILDSIRHAVTPSGLNLIGSATSAAYDARVPSAFQLSKLHPAGKCLIVLGNGGADFWRTYADAGPHHAAAHPVDAFTVECVEARVVPVLRRAGVEFRLFYPFRFTAEPLSFLHAGACAGLGVRSRLGILIHPVYGPWMALRAAISIAAALPASPPLAFDGCTSCSEQPCIRACPGGAISRVGWDVPACARQRLQEPDSCAEGCHARLQCIYGQGHRYPLAAQRHHQSHMVWKKR